MEPTISHFPTVTIAADAYAIPLSDAWFTEAAEGELAVDVYETPDHFVVQSTVAGLRPYDLTLSLHRDLLTIRGRREEPVVDDATTERAYLSRECYWGSFSRSIILPEAIDVPRATATLRHGILTIVLPKRTEQTAIGVTEVP